MDQNTELLNYIYQNSQMGIETIKQILTIVKDEDFTAQLNTELKEYSTINEKSCLLLKEHGCDAKGINAFEKMMGYMMINIKTLTNESPAHIAEMMIKGSNMGIIDAAKKSNEYPNADKKIHALMKELEKLEENNVEKLKKFL